MKPKNFPGRKYARKQRAMKRDANALGIAFDGDHQFATTYISDICFRVGKSKRDARGLPR